LQSFRTSEGHAGISVQVPEKLANPDLKWGANQGLDLGIDFGLVKNKISGTIRFYNEISENILVNVSATLFAVIFAGRLYINSEGVRLRNQDIEFEVTTRYFVGEDFR
jgi:hypothetical protein